MRSLAIAASLLIGLGAGAASADPDGPSAVPSAADIKAPAESPPEDTVSPDDLRNALLENQAPSGGDPDKYTTGTFRLGTFLDSDKTAVYRALGTLSHTRGHWLLSGSFGVDAVTSASVDVRSSPALSKVDTVTTASGRTATSGGQMTDTRYQATAGAGWKDTTGHAIGLTAAVARESDYTSVSGGLNGSYDVLDRTTTLLGGVSFTDNWISSVLDPALHHKMFSAGWSAGIARVLTRDDALRLRYDGKISEGFQSSPYRSVRFGDWTADLGSRQITFMNTIGSADGLAERMPGSRISHAGVLEWVHSLAPGIGLHPELRASHDSWGVNSLSAAVDVRIAKPTWRMDAGYRYYAQTAASFFEDKYTQAPNMYTYYTSDKELGDQRGHLLRFDLSRVLIDADGPNASRLLLNLQVDLARYSYPGFTLLPSRDSVFAAVGLSWER